MGDWIEWNGGECPVEDGTHIDARYRNGGIQKNCIAWSNYRGVVANANAGSKAGPAFWRHDGTDNDIIAYRLAEPASVPPVPPAPDMPDLVNAPPHYKQGAIECIDAIRSALTAEEFRGHCKANAIKYIWRESHKGGDESIRKAIWYLEAMLK